MCIRDRLQPAQATAIGGLAIGPNSDANQPYCIAIGTQCATGKSEHIVTAKGLVLECDGGTHFNVGASAGISASLVRPKCQTISINGKGQAGTCLFPFTPLGASPERQIAERYSCMPPDPGHPDGPWCQLGSQKKPDEWGYCTEGCQNPQLPMTTCERRRRLDSDTHIPATETHVDMVSYPTVHLGGIVHANNVVMESLSSSADRRVKKNIRPANTQDMLRKINALHLREYDYSDAYRRHAAKLQASSVGFIAQEVEQVLPEAILTRSSQTLYGSHVHGYQPLETHENFKMLNKQLLFTHAIGAVQELSRQLRRLHDSVSQMERRLEEFGE